MSLFNSNSAITFAGVIGGLGRQDIMQNEKNKNEKNNKTDNNKINFVRIIKPLSILPKLK